MSEMYTQPGKTPGYGGQPGQPSGYGWQPGQMPEYNWQPEQRPVVDLKKERSFCNGIGLSYFVFLVVVTLLQLGITMAVQVFCEELMYLHYPLFFLMTMLPIYVIGYPILLGMNHNKPAVKRQKHSLGAGNFMIVLMMCFGVMIVGNILGLIVNGVIGAIRGSAVDSAIDSVMTGNSFWMNVLVVGILAPVFEELIFRKLLVDRMLRYGEAVAVLVSGLMFGLFHGNFGQFFYATFLGLIFAYVYAKTANVEYTIMLHMIINMLSTLMIPVLQKLTILEDMSAIADPSVLEPIVLPLLLFFLYMILLYGFGIAGIVLLIVKRKKFTFAPGEVILPKGKKASVVWGNAGMILFTIGCLAMFILVLV